jgi:Fe-S cluster biogenesis protein NfuA/nitrite reductase/ring-hydroxylating ferredoxin subunit
VEFDQAIKELETLIGTLERDEDERALLLLQLVDAIHRPAIELIVNGDLEDPIAQALLSMYDLVDVDDHILVEEALDGVRPYIESHGGELQLLDVEEGVVHVQLSGSCSGCAASAITLKRGVEEALRENYENFKELVSHEAEGEDDADGNGGGPQLLQIEGLEPPKRKLRKPVFEDAGMIDDLAPNQMKTVDVDGESILIVNVEGEPYAFKNFCPMDDRKLPLDGGRVTGKVLVCPWHNCGYDARSGKRADNETDKEDLVVVPIALRDGKLQVAVNVA